MKELLSPKEYMYSDFLQAAIKAQLEYKNSLKRRFKDNDIDLSFETVQVLIILWEKDGVNQQELADHLHKDKATLTYLLDNLAKRELIVRTEDKNDRRNKIITLTGEGVVLKERVMPLASDLFRKAVKNVTSEEMENAMAVYEKVYCNLQ